MGNMSKWQASRRSKHEKRILYNGSYDNKKTAAHASDTLARKLITNGEEGHKLNFPNDETEVFPEKKKFSSQFVGVVYNINTSKWQASRYSKHEKKDTYNGSYDNEKRAARASDTLARKLIINGEEGHKLNFPNDETEVFPELKTKSSQYIGVSYYMNTSKWRAHRRSKNEKTVLYNGYYDNEERAARASDASARKLITIGEEGHNLNFPDDKTEVFPEERQIKRKRTHHEDLGHPKNN